MHILLTLRNRRLAGALHSREARVRFTAEQWLGLLSLVQHVCDRFRLRSHGAELWHTELLVSVPHTAAWIFTHSPNHARSHTDLQRRHLRANAESWKSSVCRWWITDAAFSSDADWWMLLTAQMLNHGCCLRLRCWITDATYSSDTVSRTLLTVQILNHGSTDADSQEPHRIYMLAHRFCTQ